MTIDKGRLGLLVSTISTLVILGTAPAVAGATQLVPPTNGPIHNPMPPVSYNSDTSSSTTGTTSGSVSTGGTTTGGSQTDVTNFKQQGLGYLAQLRKNDHQATTHTAADRQKRCQSLQAMLTKQITNFGQNAQTHLGTFNSVFTKVQAYATKNNVTASQYTSLVATATTQQTAATQAVAALKLVSVTFNCTQQDPASSLATIKAAVDSTRTALQAYQKSIAAVISNLEANAPTTTTNTTKQ